MTKRDLQAIAVVLPNSIQRRLLELARSGMKKKNPAGKPLQQDQANLNVKHQTQTIILSLSSYRIKRLETIGLESSSSGSQVASRLIQDSVERDYQQNEKEAKEVYKEQPQELRRIWRDIFLHIWRSIGRSGNERK